MIKYFFLIFSLMLLSSYTQGQNHTISAGGVTTGTGGSSSFTVGQIDNINVSGSGGSITQGVQQPEEIFTAVGIQKNTFKLTMNVYPNPASKTVKLNINEFPSTGLSCSITDVNAKIVYAQKLKETETIIEIEELNSGIYFFHILNENNELKTFKIIKN